MITQKIRLFLKNKGDKVAGVGEVWYNNLRLKIRL